MDGLTFPVWLRSVTFLAPQFRSLVSAAAFSGFRKLRNATGHRLNWAWPAIEFGATILLHAARKTSTSDV
jgi:hypothetical protein